MFKKVTPSHPDKIANRIAGAIVDLAYTIEKNPKIAVEVLIGHGECNIIIESNVYDKLSNTDIQHIVYRICKDNTIFVDIHKIPQDTYLANNQIGEIKCGDNGIFKGTPVTYEQQKLSLITQLIYDNYPYDGKYIYDEKKDIIIGCQSHIQTNNLINILKKFAKNVKANPLGDWTGGIDSDSGATNRKLGSDMGDSVTGGGLHGKDLSKADVAVNIYCFLKAQELKNDYELYCAIGDDTIDGKKYSEIVEIAREYIERIGGFEKFAEWGLITYESSITNRLISKLNS